MKTRENKIDTQTLNILKNTAYITICTHDGRFYADEIIAIGLISTFVNNMIEIERICHLDDKKDLINIYKCDFAINIGGVYEPEMRIFDQRQLDPVETPYSVAGLLYRWLKCNDLICESARKELDPFIEMVDKIRIGKWDGPYIGTIPWMLENINAVNPNGLFQEGRFKYAVEIATNLIKYTVEKNSC